MKKRVSRILAITLALLMLMSSLGLSALAATYRPGAQAGPSASYAGSKYYQHYQRVPITGDNRTDLIAIALSQLGYQEGAADGYFSGEVSGSNNYVEMSYNLGDLGLGYGGSDYPWCASFVSWCLYQSRCTNHGTYSTLCRYHSGDYTYIWKEISCAMWVNQLKGAGYFSYSAGMGGSYTPQYGDLVFFKSSSSPSHIGICLYVKDGVLYTVEGNTSDASGLETNGGGVYFKSYSLSSSYLYGYGRLPYVSDSSVKKVDYSGANPTPGLYISNAAKYIYANETTTTASYTIPRFSMFEITRVGSNNRLYGTFTDTSGNTVTGWIENNSSRIIQLYASNVLSGSWTYDGTGYKYQYSDGSYAAEGWLQDPDNSAWYYIGADGYAQNGWLYLSNGTFYLDPSSNAMLTGHLYLDGIWYYFNSDGYLCDGEWQHDGTDYKFRFVDGTYAASCWVDDSRNNYARYYIGADGYAVSGWQTIDGTRYYFDPDSNALLRGWLYIDGNWYYTNSEGAMQTGWIELDGAYYYLDPTTGVRASGTVEINGATCIFDEDGKLTEGTIIEDTDTVDPTPEVETPTTNGYDSYTGGMPADGTGTVLAEGIDISKWNNGEDWSTLKLNLEAVAAAGIDFVIMRCGSTNKGEDPMFDMYYEECKRLGLDVGVYFYTYALDAETALSDAQKCLSYIEGKQLEYPVYLDFEDPTHETIGGTLSATICKTFMDEVASHNYLTGLYSYKSWLELDWVTTSGLRSKYEAWAAYPVLSKNHAKYDAEMSSKFGMYQYTFEYEIANAGTFDANVCYKDYPTIVKTYGFNNYGTSSSTDMGALWVQDENGFRYQYSDGTFATAGWLWDETNSGWYYLDANGYAVSGWVEDGGKTYYLDPNCNAMVTGYRYIDGVWYYFDSSGALVTTGTWVVAEGGHRYQMADGTFVISQWFDDFDNGGVRYYLDENGYAVGGFNTIDGTLYYFDPVSHALLRGWLSVDGNMYCTADDGAILKGFQYIDGEYYYFDESTGVMQTGFVNVGDKWYYFDSEGKMVTGWFTSPNTGYVYYFNTEGEMTTGWAEVDGSWYFFQDDMEEHYGSMQTGFVVSSVSGYTYYLGEDGKMVTGWQQINGNYYYFDPTEGDYIGKMTTGWIQLDGTYYFFGDDGVLLDISEPTEATEATESTAATEATEVTESTAATETTEATDPAESTVATEPSEAVSYKATWDTSDAYTVTTAQNAESIAQGESFSFTAEATDGYVINAVVVNSQILIPTDGVYTVENVTSDIKILVITYKVETPQYYKVTFADADGSIIDVQYIEAGKAATAPESPSKAGYTFTGWDKAFDSITADVTVTAVYEKNADTPTVSDKGRLKVEVAGGTGFTISFEDGTPRPQGTSYYNTSAPVNADVTVTALSSDGAEFMGWIDATDNRVLSTELTYSFRTSGNNSIKAMFKSVVENANMVMFYVDVSDQQWDVQYYSATDSISFPSTDPMCPGLEFKGWSMTEEEIKAELALGNDVTVLPLWEKQLVYYSVSVENGSVTYSAGTNSEGKYLANSKTTVTANAAADNCEFAYWVDGNGKVRSYSTEYSFYPQADMSLKAVFVEAGTEIEYKALVSVDSFTVVEPYGQITVSWEVPAEEMGVTYIDAGLIAVKSTSYNADRFYHGATLDGMYDKDSPATLSSNTLVWTGPILEGETWYVKAWAQYETADGETVTVYSDMYTIER